MQGAVWAGLMCTTSMDKLGKEVYNDPTLVYKYRGNVDVPNVRQLTAAPAEQGRKVVRVTYLSWKLSELKKL